MEALEHSPENAHILTTVGLLFLRVGENNRAFDYLGNSMVQDPRSLRTILAAGAIFDWLVCMPWQRRGWEHAVCTWFGSRCRVHASGKLGHRGLKTARQSRATKEDL